MRIKSPGDEPRVGMSINYWVAIWEVMPSNFDEACHYGEITKLKKLKDEDGRK